METHVGWRLSVQTAVVGKRSFADWAKRKIKAPISPVIRDFA